MLPQCSHLIGVFYTICVGHTALFYLGKSLAMSLSGCLIQKKDTKGTEWLRSPVTHALFGPVCYSQEENLCLLNSQTQPGHRIVTHRMSPCLFSCTWLTRMGRKLCHQEIIVRKLASGLCLSLREVSVCVSVCVCMLTFLSGKYFVRPHYCWKWH